MITREQWAAAKPTYAGNKISARPLGVVIHWEGPKMGVFTHDKCAGKVRGIQAYHQRHQGWADIAYNFVVCPHGSVFEGRGLYVGSGANGTERYNRDYYAVCAMVGVGDPIGPDMMRGIQLAVGICRERAGTKILGHRDCVATSCPGPDLYGAVTKGAFDKPLARASRTVKRVAVAVKAKVIPPVLRQGSSGAAVRALQVGMNRVFPSYSKLAVDGLYGPGTARVVKEFQRRCGLSQDGVVGPNTRATLKQFGITF
jgi:hypothetical protein